jgi:butyryl-CoA dehydrogenase
MCTHNTACMPLLREGTEEQKQRYLRPMARGEFLSSFCLTEPHGGSDALNLRTRAVQSDGKWIVNGTKSFVTNGRLADVALVFAVTEPDAGKRRLSAFLLETSAPGFIVSRVEKKMGQNASDTCEIQLQDVTLPPQALIGQIGDGYRIALGNLEGGRIAIAAQATGMARAALELAIAYSNERTSFGKRIVEHQAVSFRLADMATRVEAARSLYLHAATLRSAGEPCQMEASMAKLFASEIAERVCSDAIQTLGGAGYMRDFVVERIYRAARVCKIYEGTNDILRIVIGRALTGRRD